MKFRQDLIDGGDHAIAAYIRRKNSKMAPWRKRPVGIDNSFGITEWMSADGREVILMAVFDNTRSRIVAVYTD